MSNYFLLQSIAYYYGKQCFFMPNGYIYLFQNETDGLIKIGYTRGNINKRRKQLLTGSSGEITVVKTILTTLGTTTEAYLHNVFNSKNVRGEWFNLNQEDIERVDMLCEKFENNMKILLDNQNHFVKKT